MSAESTTRPRAWRYAEPRAPQGEVDRRPELQANPRFWLRVAIAAGATFTVGAAWAVIVVQFGGWTHGLPREVDLLARLHRQLPIVVDWVVVQLPWLGTNLVFVPVLGPACWYLWQKRRRPDLAIIVAVTMVGNYVLGTALKLAFERPRPALWVGRGEYTGSAYPSGHVMAVTSVIGVIAMLLYEKRGAVSPVVAWMMLLIATCYSRLYLGVHWPADVVGGLLAGGTWFVGILWATRAGGAVRSAATLSRPQETGLELSPRLGRGPVSARVTDETTS
jgi:membrane-associated phospholipid phosphatase